MITAGVEAAEASRNAPDDANAGAARADASVFAPASQQRA